MSSAKNYVVTKSFSAVRFALAGSCMQMPILSAVAAGIIGEVAGAITFDFIEDSGISLEREFKKTAQMVGSVAAAAFTTSYLSSFLGTPLTPIGALGFHALSFVAGGVAIIAILLIADTMIQSNSRGIEQKKILPLENQTF